MILTIASNKGGCGKTTSAIAIAHGLAQAGHNTLLVDVDSQGHCAISLGMDPEPGIFQYVIAGSPLANVIRRTGRDGLTLLPGDSRTKTAELVGRYENGDAGMHLWLAELAKEWDAVVVDTPASGLFQEIAIRLADRLIVPARLEALGIDGVNATLAIAHKLGSPAGRIVLPVAYDKRLSEHQYNLNILGEIGTLVSEPVPARVAVAEAVACGRTIWEYGGQGIEDVRAAYRTLLDRLEVQP